MAGKLYIVATPIGNLGDITHRAVDILGSVDIIYAEDTRVTKNLLAKYNIDKPLHSYHQHSLIGKREEILNNLLQGKNIAVVTDAGTPGISDPGNELLDYLYEYMGSTASKFFEASDDLAARTSPGAEPNLEITPIPGPSSLTAALSVSGFNVNKFLFLGFLPKKKRTKLFEWAKEGHVAIAFFDNPKRLFKSLQEVSEHFGKGRRVLVARELTKIHETLYRGTIAEIMDIIDKEKGGKNKFNLKGEVVVVIEG